VTALRFPAEIAVGEVWWEDAREPGDWGHLLAIGVVEVPDGRRCGSRSSRWPRSVSPTGWAAGRPQPGPRDRRQPCPVQSGRGLPGGGECPTAHCVTPGAHLGRARKGRLQRRGRRGACRPGVHLRPARGQRQRPQPGRHCPGLLRGAGSSRAGPARPVGLHRRPRR